MGADPWWLQVYVLRDCARTRDLVQQAADLGARALVLTGDTPYVGRKAPGPRSGLDVLPALALGGWAVLLGRPVLWALATDGPCGVETCLRPVTDDLAGAMALAGAASLAEITPDLVG